MSACNEANGWMALYMEVVMSRVGSRVAQKSHGQTPQLMMVGDRPSWITLNFSPPLEWSGLDNLLGELITHPGLTCLAFKSK